MDVSLACFGLKIIGGTMFEKVNPSHSDKVADRVAGAIVDLAYLRQQTPKVAVEVLIGHGEAMVIIESSVEFSQNEVAQIVERIAKTDVKTKLLLVPQDPNLAANQKEQIRCGDNGIFKGCVPTDAERNLSQFVRDMYKVWPTDGKMVLDARDKDHAKLTICQSQANAADIRDFVSQHKISKQYSLTNVIINPLGEWTGGVNVDSGATNRKLGTDMGRAVTGGGLHGKDLSKADVSINIYAHQQALKQNTPIEYSCSIGDVTVDGISYADMVASAGEYIKHLGGFEKLAEWGLV